MKEIRFGEARGLPGLYAAAETFLVLHFEKVVEHPIGDLRKPGEDGSNQL